MFQTNRRRGLKQALEEASDHELRELREELAARQEKMAQLQLELFETRSDLTRFERELDDRIGGLKEKLQGLEAELLEARRRTERRAQWGSRAETSEVPEDVVEQFQRKWRPKEKQPPPQQPTKALDEATKDELKSLYRSLAKRFHPDLALDPKEKDWRERRMAEVNVAYGSQDVRRLQSIAEKPDWLVENLPKTRDETLRGLYADIRRLDHMIETLELQMRELVNSQTVKLMLDVRFAQREGRDLIAEMANELKIRIAGVQNELAAL